MINGLDLFSGIGGLALALSGWVRPVAYCEIDRYAQAVLLSRIADGTILPGPIWDDVRTLGREHFSGPIDIVYGGFPCQDISAAGLGIGLGGERSGLFHHIARLVGETNPRFVFLENVPAIRTRGLNCVAQTFTELGYDCRWTIVSAAEVGAPHLRKRWFMLAHASGDGRLERRAESEGIEGRSSSAGGGSSMGDSASERLSHGPAKPLGEQEPLAQFERSDWWTTEPDVGRVAHGLPFRVDRLRGLGNAVVPRQAQVAFKRLMGLEQ